VSLPPSLIWEEPPPQPDSAAQAESLAIASGRLKRDESRQAHLHVGGLVLFWFVVICFLATAAVLIFHLLAPAKWHFLDDAQLGHVQTLVVTALGSSFATNYGKKLLDKSAD
jgi:hypothetical protein